MKKKFIIILFSAIIAILLFLLITSLAGTCFYAIVNSPNEPRIIVANDGTRDYAMVEFMDHPPWSHSRFFTAEYDFDARQINLCHYYMPFHPFSKPINTSNIIVLHSFDGRYELRFSDRVIGTVTFDNNVVAYEKLPD